MLSVWRAPDAVFKRLMNIHSNQSVLHYGFKNLHIVMVMRWGKGHKLLEGQKDCLTSKTKRIGEKQKQHKTSAL